MTRLLLTTTHFAASPLPPPPPPPEVDSDVVVVLATLLCALICVVGLSLVARCTWLRRSVSRSPPAPPNKGLKKNVLHSIPKVPFSGGGRLVECAICLAEFTDGDAIRILPHCGHGFHVGCVDKWLSSHPSCPSCRRVAVVAPPPSRCSACSASSDVVVETKECDVNRFLP